MAQNMLLLLLPLSAVVVVPLLLPLPCSATITTVTATASATAPPPSSPPQSIFSSPTTTTTTTTTTQSIFSSPTTTTTTTREWTWLSGASTGPGEGRNGAQGQPGARCCAHTWTIDGFLYLFGGFGVDSNGTESYLSDLWSYSMHARTWRHVTGPLTGNRGSNVQAGVPAARNYAITWTDTSRKHIYLWSGYGSVRDGDDQGYYLQDMWRFDVSTLAAASSKTASLSTPPKWERIPDAPAELRPAARTWTQFWDGQEGQLWVFSGTARPDDTDHITDGTTRVDRQHHVYRGAGGHSSSSSSSSSSSDSSSSDSSSSDSSSSDSATRVNRHHGLALPNDLWHYDAAKGKWALLANHSSLTGIYTHGANSGARPGAREGGYCTFDARTKRLLLHGGMGIAKNASEFANLQDTWAYDTRSHTWEWVAGPDVTNVAPVFGAIGVFAHTNVPPGEHAGYMWPQVDADGYSYFLGGENGKEPPAMRNDLWAFSPSPPHSTDNKISKISNKNTSSAAAPSSSTSERVVIVANGSDGAGGDGRRRSGDGRDGRDRGRDRGGAWAWMSGAKYTNASAQYGTRGHSSPHNHPGARYAGQAWLAVGQGQVVQGEGGETGGQKKTTANSTTLFLFGGYGYDAGGVRRYLNDLWTWG